MKFLSDWTTLALALGLICGGLVIGRRIGAFAACWLAGAAWLAFQLADRLWKPAVMQMRTPSPDADFTTLLPLTYGMLFAAMLVPTLVVMLIVKPRDGVPLPPRIDEGLGFAGGLLTGILLWLAVVQSFLLHPETSARMRGTVSVATPVLTWLGQNHVAAPDRPSTNPGQK